MSRFEVPSDWSGDVLDIDEKALSLYGGGDWYDDQGDKDISDVDSNVRERAEELATKYGMVITGVRGEWHGYSEYTPDPGDVTIFYWSKV
jgi:hypothetical protein